MNNNRSFILNFSWVGIAIVIFFGLISIIQGNIAYGIIELFFAVLAILNIIAFRLHNNTRIAAGGIMLLMYAILTLLLITGGIGGTGLFWFFTLPPLAFFLFGRKTGWYWIIGIFILTLLLFGLHSLGIIPLAFSFLTIRQLLASLFAVSFLVFIYENIREKNKNILQEKTEQLFKINASLHSEVNAREKAQTDLAGNISKLQDTKKAILNVLEDLHEEKDKVTAREQDLAEAQRIGKFGSFVWNLKTNEVSWSDESFHIHGWEPTENHTPPPMDKYFDTIIPEDREGAKKSMENAVKTNKENEYVYRVAWKDKSIHFIKVASKLLFDKNKKPDIIKGTFQDISKEAEVDHMKTEFLSLASHQLRTPLTAIKWLSELLSDSASTMNQEQKDILAKIQKSNDHMIELVNSLLNVSRLEQGRITVEPQPTDLIKLLSDVLTETTPSIEKKKQKITTNLPEKPLNISIDPKLIRQVYLNLITNASKYSPDQSNIIITLTTKDKDILFSIADQGLGIPQKEQEKIFKKFFRASNAALRETDGNGLGLYLIKQIVEVSGGKIWFESTEGKGSTFYFTLPISGSTIKKGDKSLEG